MWERGVPGKWVVGPTSESLKTGSLNVVEFSTAKFDGLGLGIWAWVEFVLRLVLGLSFG